MFAMTVGMGSCANAVTFADHVQDIQHMQRTIVRAAMQINTWRLLKDMEEQLEAWMFQKPEW